MKRWGLVRAGTSMAWAVWLGLGIAQCARAGDAGSPYDLLKEKADTLNEKTRSEGWSYVISGGLVLGMSIPGYYLSKDVFARTVYATGETLGVAAVGYGSYLVLIENDYTRFEKALAGVPDLSLRQRDRLAQGFLKDSAERARNVRKIRVITHGLTAALNFLNGATTNFEELRTALYFLGGINTLAAVGFGLKKSEEEKQMEGLARVQGSGLRLEWFVGPVTGVRVAF